ncbi:MAG: thymidylate kinase [Patescibacteria group bacterium]|nr:thymidylate kinase [Patescibacteria group bacterium]
MGKSKKGKLIVIDGIDGSGKATQSTLLKKRLRREGIKVRTIDFPRYENNFFGKIIGDYLAGTFGDFIQVDPRIASVLYAADRFESGDKIQAWLSAGYVVLTDRYVSANQIHQGGKISSPQKRKKFLKWLDVMEYDVFKIPRPDLVIYLDVPYEVSREWLRKKVARRSKKYLKGRRDVAEDNLIHLRNSRASALNLEKANKNWRKISCCKGMVCMSPEEVHEHVFKLVKKKLG